MHYFLLLFLCLTNCAAFINEKRAFKTNTNQDLKTLLTPPSQPHIKPPIKQKIIKKDSLNPLFYKKISLTLHKSAPFQSILSEAASDIGVSILIDHTIKESVHYNAKNKAFIEVIEDLAESLKLRFSVKNTFIKIEKDTPYHKTYPVHFLKFERESHNSISTTTDIFHENDQKKHLKNNSDSEIKVKSLINFWDELKKGLAFYIGPDHFNINQQSGLVTIVGTEKQQKFIEQYLGKLEKAANAQVLIEAKIIEVKLSQEFNTGIDWAVFETAANPLSFSIGMQPTNNAPQFLNFKNANFSLLLKTLEKFGSLRTVSSPRLILLNNQTSIIKVAENSIFFKMDFQTQYLGIVEKPKQGAEHERFKTFSTSEIKSKPIGFIMPIQASIQQDTGKILLFVRPTVSRKSHEIDDPAMEFNAKSAKITNVPVSKIPVVEVREMDSVLKLNNGDTTIFGGLTIVKSKDQSAGLVKPSAFDSVRSAFGDEKIEEEIYELVILIKATIIDDDHNMGDVADERLQREFIKDPRAFS